MKTLNKIAIITTITVISGAVNAANIVGTQSDNNGGDHIEVGESNINIGPHTSEMAGVGVSNTFLFKTRMKVDFAGLSNSSKTTETFSNGTTVYQLRNPIVNTNPFHRQLGDFNFIKVGDGDVWIGEWSRNNSNDFDGRQVYYVGELDGTSVPVNGSATYTTYGVNKFTGNNLLAGTLTADFGDRTLDGSITNGTMTLHVNNAEITPASATFNGNATVSNVAGSGTVRGHFFGNQAAALAGIAEFSNKDLNTAFGGTKN